MAAPSLQPLEINQPLGTPAAEWAQQTVEAIDPNASTGVVTDANGNPTTDHTKSALGGEPGSGMNAGKTGALLEAQKIRPPSPAKETVPTASQNTTGHDERPQTEPAPKLHSDAQENPTTNPDASALPDVPGGVESHAEPQVRPAPKLYTDIQGNPTTDPSASALAGTPGIPGHQQSASVASTPGVQLPGGWIRGPESRQHSIIIPETSLYEDVSAALGTVGQAAFSVLPASVVGSISNNPEQGGANPSAAQTEPTTETKSSPAPPRSGSPGLLSRAQGMLTGLLARPASPPAKLPVPDAPTTTGEAALVGGGSVAETANKHGENIAAGQDLGGHNPKGVLEDDEQARLEKEASATAISPESANTAANFLNADIPTPDPTKPPQDSGLSGSVLPVLPDDGKKSKHKGLNLGSLISPDHDVQEAASKSNRDFSVPIPGTSSEESKSPDSAPAVKTQPPLNNEKAQPIVTKASDSGVKERLLDIKDVVAAPFAGSRAPRDSEELARVASDPSKKDKIGPAPIDQATKSSANPEGIRTAANPHTAHTGLPLPKDEAGKEHVGGTAVLSTPSPTGKQDGRGASENKERRRASESNKDTVEGAHIPGISSHGEEGVSTAAAANGAPVMSEKATGNGTAPGSPNKGVSRLWSRSRRSVDEGTIGSKTTRSRFSEHEPSTGSDSPSTPASPSGSKFKVPLKDKIKGELKIISGKVSRNEAKVEQGIALKTGHAHADESTSPTTGKH